ncbi:hypothetical protein [Paenibacillus puerhi]|uniref:hypothetical protein n=1 Tax=Paenibacillus puerhi TaxID=2692622 RepID=UPI001359798E|nr:hypothetical protein [Paenibacillus puerhi]
MMKLKKVTTSLAVSAILASVAVICSCSAETPVKGVDLSTDTITTFDFENVVVSESISGRKYETSFSIPEHYGWVKVWVNNPSSDEIIIHVTQDKLTGTSKLLFKVPAGQSGAGYASSPWSTGTHWVSITGKNSADLSGSLSVKLTATQEFTANGPKRELGCQLLLCVPPQSKQLI